MHLRELDANLIVVLDALLIDASVSKAAIRLGRSPSAVSHALSNLRVIFDDELFVRAGQRLVPTARAKQIAPTIHVIVSGIETLLRPATPFDPALQDREFVLSCKENAELNLLTHLRHMLTEKAPSISVLWQNLQEPHCFEEMRAGKIDFLIVEGEVQEDAADFIWKKIYKDDLVLVKGKQNKKIGQKVTPKVLRDILHIRVPDSGADMVFERVLAEKNIKRDNALHASSPIIAVHMALEYDALICLPRQILKRMQGHLPIVEVAHNLPKLSVDYLLGWHSSYERDECHEWLRGEISRLSGAEN